SQICADPSMLDRFTRDIDVTSRLKHPNIVKVYDSGVAKLAEQNYPFMAMEIIDGDIAEILEKKGPFKPEEAVLIALAAGQALAFAHKEGVIHRDVKPENILMKGKVVNERAIRVTDFGVAALTQSDTKLTQTTAAIGSPHYMAPEQARNAKDIDGRADVYALGATLYHLLTGRRLFTAETIQGLLLAHDARLPQRADTVLRSIPNDLATLVDYAVLKQVKHRPADMEEWLQDLRAWLNKSLDKQRLKVIKGHIALGRRAFENKRNPVPMLVMAVLLILVSSAAAFLFLNQKKLDPYANQKALIAKLEGASSGWKVAKEKGDFGESLSHLSVLDGEKLPGDLSAKRDALAKQLDLEQLAFAEKKLAPYLAEPLKSETSALRGRLKDILGALEKRVEEKPWKAELAEKLAMLKADMGFLNSVEGLQRDLQGLVNLETSGAFEALLGTKNNGEFQGFEQKLAKLDGGDLGEKKRGALGILTKWFEEMKKGVREAYAAFEKQRFDLEKRLQSSKSEGEFKETLKDVDKLLKAIPSTNPQMLARVTKLTASVDPMQLKARESFQRLVLNAKDPKLETQYAAQLADLSAFRERFKKYIEANKALELMRVIEKKRDQEATAQFQKISKALDEWLQSLEKASLQALVSPSDFQKKLTGIETVAGGPRFKGMTALDALKSAEKKRLTKALNSYGPSLLRRALKELQSRLDKSTQKEFLGKLSLVERAIKASLAFPGADSKSSQVGIREIALLRSLHSETKLAAVKGGVAFVGANEEGFAHFPLHQTKLTAFLMDRTEVSVEQYQSFLESLERQQKGKSASYTPKKWTSQLKSKSLPIRGVTLGQARAYARWAGKRLPTEIEWEHGARGGLKEAGPYAWGDEDPTKRLARYGLEEGAPLEVSSLGAGAAPGGLYHMSGNVSEWTESPFKAYPGGNQAVIAAFPNNKNSYVTRGGNYSSDEADLQIWNRVNRVPSAADMSVGFRCVVNP
ncbi:MAG: SUMF1/EgtB/PvdO family nonheme iron enzyme, partial [Planctomycetota bacterium]|nr:SUMF1/EgtB/PvdO family nonheme iron enzyme [Planctomycetota bacterium]